MKQFRKPSLMGSLMSSYRRACNLAYRAFLLQDNDALERYALQCMILAAKLERGAK